MLCWLATGVGFGAAERPLPGANIRCPNVGSWPISLKNSVPGSCLWAQIEAEVGIF
jgi:hypothetical protein